MPYYSELGIYTPSSSYTSPLIKGPYSCHSSILASNILPPSSKQYNRSNFRSFKPHLMPISESSNVNLPLRRINSPKLLYHSSPKVRVQRPIKINTADIDVSVNRFRKYSPQSKSPRTSPDSKSPKPQKELKPPDEPKEAKPNAVIKRDRATIRLQTIHKDALEKEIGEIRSWRDNFKPEELVTEAKRQRRTPGEILKEKFLIRSKSKDNLPKLEPSKKLSIKRSPSFKDICDEITSDQVIEDLNPGQPVNIRRRQSRKLSHNDVIRELHRSSSTLSVEEVQILDALLQAENEVGLYDVPPVVEEQPKNVRKRKVAKKKSSELSVEDKKTEKQVSSAEKAAIPNLTKSSVELNSVPKKYIRKSSSEISIPDTSVTSHSRLRKDSSLKDMVKDISQVEIEMIPIKQKPVITGYVDTIEEKAKSNLKAIVEDLDIQESPKQVKKEKKFRFNVTVQEFPVKKIITAPKYELKNDNSGIIQIPCIRKGLVTSILKKNEQFQQGICVGDGKVFKKKEEKPVEISLKKKLVKSLSEVQVKSSDQNQLKKSESNDSLHTNFAIRVNRTKSDETFATNSNKSNSNSTNRSLNEIRGIQSLEQSKTTVNSSNVTSDVQEGISEDDNKVDKLDEICEIQSLEQNKTTTNDSNDSSDIPVSIRQDDNNANKSQPKDETNKPEVLFQSTRKDLKAGTFLCKTDINNRDSVPKWAERLRKEETNIEEILLTDKEELPKKSMPAEENSVNDLKTDTKDEEIFAPTQEEGEKTDNSENIDKVDTDSDSSLKIKLKELNIEQHKEDSPKIELLPKSSAKLRKEEKPATDENDNKVDFWSSQEEEKYEPPKLDKLKLGLKDPKTILDEIQEGYKESGLEIPETPEEKEKKMMSKRSLIEKANKEDPDLHIFEPPTPPTPVPVKSPSPEPSFVPLQSNRLSQWMHPWKKPEQKEEQQREIYAKPKFIRARHIPRRWQQQVAVESEDSTTSEEDSSSEDSDDESEEESEEEQAEGVENKVGASTSSNDSGFDSGRTKNDGSIDSRDSPGNTLRPASNPAFALDFNDLPEEVSQSSTYQSFQRSGRITPPATTIPRFRKYCVDDFNFLKVLGKGSFGKVLLAELKGTEYYYAIKCLKKDVVLEDDDVECTLIERKVLALGTKHPYLCHLLCTFQTESHLFFVMEYLNGGDLMFHIQAERRFSEARARFYGAEIVSGLKFLHNKGIVYRDLKLDNILLDFDGHVRIADFGMCKLQIFLDRMADTFCGTPDYMAPEIIKGQHYNQCVDWWSFGVLLYEMLLGQSPFSGCDEDELFWSICNEKPVIPRFLSAEANSVLTQFLDKDANKRLGNRFSPHGDIQDHVFFQPIDWIALEKRQLEPPFKPNLQHPLDTQYFDKTFTTERAKLTPIETGILQSMDQTQFQGFSYTNPNATDK